MPSAFVKYSRIGKAMTRGKILFLVASLISILLLSLGSIRSGRESGESWREEATEVSRITQHIKANGPPEIQELDQAIIERTVQTFVSGRRAKTISEEQLSRLGGIEGAVILSLQAQLKAR